MELRVSTNRLLVKQSCEYYTTTLRGATLLSHFAESDTEAERWSDLPNFTWTLRSLWAPNLAPLARNGPYALAICTRPSQPSFYNMSLTISLLLRAAKTRFSKDNQSTSTPEASLKIISASNFLRGWGNTYAGKKLGEMIGISPSTPHHHSLTAKESTVYGPVFWKNKTDLIMVMTMLPVNQKNLPLSKRKLYYSKHTRKLALDIHL